uniref:Uncharacterized protein n=1 Tax=Nelumbo nucifera TaxID=4432 RepID=A0A822XH46_NELNU|nr:TPA_asm: hypothetical protein HUJ06_019822 [Nelumbo nucifera]
MQTPCLNACKNCTNSPPFLGFSSRNFCSYSESLVVFSGRKVSPRRIFCSFNGGNRRTKASAKQGRKNGGGDKVKTKEKENVWSVDNELAKKEAMVEKEKFNRRRRGRKVRNIVKKDKNSRVMVSGAMLMEVETVLQTQVFCLFLLHFVSITKVGSCCFYC